MYKQFFFRLFSVLLILSVSCTTVTQEPTSTATPEIEGTVEGTATVDPTAGTATAEPVAQATVTPSSSPTAGNPAIIVIEGPITAINNNIITIFDIDIQVGIDDPILTIINVGDIIRVEGENTFEGNTIIIVAVNITIIQSTVIIINNGGNGGTETVLPPGCKITKKGKIKCSNKKTNR
jgi:hypothetical protein